MQTFADLPALKAALEGVAGSPTPSTPGRPNCAICSPTPTRSPRCWPSAATRSPRLVANTNALLGELVASTQFRRPADGEPRRGLAGAVRSGRHCNPVGSSPLWINNGVLSILDNRVRPNCSARCICCGATRCRSVKCSVPDRSSRPRWSAWSPPVRPTVHRRGVLRPGPDPNVLLPSQLTDPGGANRAHPLPAPYPRPPGGAASHAARCDHRQAGRSPLPVPGAAARTTAGRTLARAAGTGTARRRAHLAPAPARCKGRDRRRRPPTTGVSDHGASTLPGLGGRAAAAVTPWRHSSSPPSPWSPGLAPRPQHLASPVSPTPTASTGDEVRILGVGGGHHRPGSNRSPTTPGSPSRSTPAIPPRRTPRPRSCPRRSSARAPCDRAGLTWRPAADARRGDPTGAHRGSRRVGRLPPSSRSSPTHCSPPFPAARAHPGVHQHHGGQPAVRGPPPATR